MPKLTDIAVMTVGKNRVNNVRNSLYEFRRTSFSRPELALKNQLRTDIKVVDVKLGKISYNTEHKGVFANWCDDLNRQPMMDLFQSNEPINVVKSTERNDIAELQIELKRREWMEDVKTRMRILGFKA